jgi:hypothetical protein
MRLNAAVVALMLVKTKLSRLAEWSSEIWVRLT